MGHLQDYLGVGVDMYAAFQAVQNNNAMMFSLMFSAAIVDGGRAVGIKELTAPVVEEFMPEINALFTKIMAHVHPAA